MNTHTPGPWRIGKTHPLNISANSALVAVVSKRGSYTTEHEANARLIACAPELLEALEALLYSAEALRDDCESVFETRSEPPSFIVARAAIEKAKG